MITEEGWDPWFEMKIAGWIVTTQFTFGRQENMIEYYQAIQSEAKVPNPSFSPEFWVAAMRLEQLISFASWLGICSQTQWKYPTEEDVDQACDIFIKFCGYFLEAAPKLLKGLEFEKITDGKAAIFAASQSV